MAHSQDLGRYYRIPADNRDLNYDKFFVEGDAQLSTLEDFTSHNTRRLTVPEIKEVLLKLSIVREAVGA
jgi:UDP-glucose 4-epimerase